MERWLDRRRMAVADDPTNGHTTAGASASGGGAFPGRRRLAAANRAAAKNPRIRSEVDFPAEGEYNVICLSDAGMPA